MEFSGRWMVNDHQTKLSCLHSVPEVTWSSQPHCENLMESMTKLGNLWKPATTYKSAINSPQYCFSLQLRCFSFGWDCLILLPVGIGHIYLQWTMMKNLCWPEVFVFFLATNEMHVSCVSLDARYFSHLLSNMLSSLVSRSFIKQGLAAWACVVSHEFCCVLLLTVLLKSHALILSS